MKTSCILIISGFLLLGGCASIVEGRSQEITVHTSPEGASCRLLRKDIPLGTIAATPGTFYLEKTKDDIIIKCAKAGFAETAYLNESGYPEDNWLYILVGGPIGWGFDSITGADNKYTSPVTIPLARQ